MDIPQLNYRHVVNGEELVIAISQDYKTGEVLMVAYMNRDAFEKTVETGKPTTGAPAVTSYGLRAKAQAMYRKSRRSTPTVTRMLCS